MQKSNRTNQLAFLMVLMALALVVVAPVSSSAGTYTIIPTDDAFVTTFSPDSTPNNQFLQVGVTIFNSYLRTYLKFDLSPIPAGEVITAGTFHLYCSGVTGNNPLIYIEPEANTAWSETTLTWNNQPTLPGVSGSQIASFTPTSGSWSDVALPTTALVDLFSLRLLSPSEETNNANYYADFYSKDTTDPSDKYPHLTVETTAVIVPLPGAALLLGSGLLGLWADRWRRRD